MADEFRLVACDLRGHGMSEAPLEPEHYTDGQRWADDVAAIVDELHLDRPTLVGWSYGAFVIGDFVRVHGQHRVGAINFVGGAVQLGPAAFGTLIGPGFLDHFADLTADDLPTNIRGLQAFLQRIVATPLPADDFQAALCWNMAVPARVRANLAARDLNFDDVLQTLQVPLLVSQGRADIVVLPAMAEHIQATAPTAEISWYDNVGHAPHLEQPDRFNRELAALTHRTHASQSAHLTIRSLGRPLLERSHRLLRLRNRSWRFLPSGQRALARRRREPQLQTRTGQADA
jgi:pimeloyl-ACP methyl ester carboxylesterase